MNVKMKTIKQTQSPFAKTSGERVERIKKIILELVEDGTTTRQDIAQRFKVDISTVSAADCVYKYVLEELARENAIEEVQAGKRYIYRKPSPTLF